MLGRRLFCVYFLPVHTLQICRMEKLSMSVKTINALMKYLRDIKHISIGGSTQKAKLRRIGYYHGYKGYRFFGKPSKKLAYTDFEQLISVYNFDMQVKSILYSPLMHIETALKNYVLEEILNVSNSDQFTDIYATVLNHHSDYRRSDGEYKKKLAKELSVRNKIYSVLSRDYGSKLLVQHFYEKDIPVPIWAIFEIISLGEFGTLLSCVNNATAKRISNSVGLNSAFDADGRLLEKIVFALKDLRNAVAHNDPVFDIRFKTSSPNMRIAKLLANETGVPNITFNTLTDYVVLMGYLMHCFGYPKTETKKLISDYTSCCEEFRKKAPVQLYSTIVHTDTRSKMNQLATYV